MARYSETVTNIAKEGISLQLNDNVINLLRNELEQLEYQVRNFNISSTKKVFQNTITKQITANIDNILSDRFGINFKSIPTSGDTLAATYPIIPNIGNILTDTYDDLIEAAQQIKDESNKTILNTDDVSHDRDWDGIANNLVVNTKMVEEQMGSGGIRIDFDKAKIVNLNPKIYVLLLLSYCELFKDYKLSANEVLAIILHEVGHAFTMLSYTYRSAHTNSILLDNITDNIVRKNIPNRKAVVLALNEYEHNRKIDVTSDEMAIFSNIVSGHISDIRNNISKYYSVNNEALADNFAVKFGMGDSLASALVKVQDAYDSSWTMMFYTAINLGLGMLYLVYVTAVLGLPIAIVATMLLAMLSLILSIFGYIDSTNGETYDKIHARYLRIRTEMVRQLKEMSDSAKDVANILDSINTIDAILNKTKKETDGIVSSIVDKVSKLFTIKGAVNNEKMITEQLFEILMSNNLYVSAAKIKTL